MPGAGRRPDPEPLRGRRVTLMFDNDEAGGEAVKRWARALGRCRIGLLPPGRDVSDSDVEVIRNAYTQGEAL